MKLNKEKRFFRANLTKENSSLMLKMVTSYSIFLLIILILFFYLFSLTFDNTRDEYNQQNKSTLVSNVELFEKDMDIMKVYCRQLLQQKEFRNIMNDTIVDEAYYENASKIRMLMATDIYPETLLPISEVYCYLPLTESIIDPVMFIDAERYYNWNKRYPATEQEAWFDILKFSSYKEKFLPLDQFTPLSTAKKYIYTMDLNNLYFLDANAVVCFVIDHDKLVQRFYGMDFENDNSFLIIKNQKGDEVLSLGNLQDYTVEFLDGLKYKEGFHDEFRSHTIGTYVSTDTGYTYYYGFPAYNSAANVTLYKVIYVFMILLAVGGGFLLILRFSRSNVEPIITLGQELHEAVEAKNQLEEVIDSQRPIICRSYVRQLLSGTVTSDQEAYYIMNYMGISYYEKLFNALYVVVYNNFEDGSSEGGQLPLANEELENIIIDSLRSFFDEEIFYFSPSDRTFAVLISADKAQKQEYIMRIQEIVLRLHDHLLDNYGIWLFASIGKGCDSPLNVWESYQQAQEAVSYTTKNYIFFPYEFIKKDSQVFYYPPEISTKLIHFITTGNTTQVLELLGLIHQENIEERSLPIHLLTFLLSDIRNTLLKAKFALPKSTDAESLKAIDEMFAEPPSFKLCENLAMALCKLFVSDSENEDLAVTIEKYIKANYKDPSLCLNKISDEFQISESYFSHMFKEKTGVNFSTYLENLRMAEAMRLIKETDIGINELYLAVGYNNASSFRRVFKKIYGVTPSNIREK